MNYQDIYELKEVFDKNDIQNFLDAYKTVTQDEESHSGRAQTMHRSNFINVVRKKSHPEIHREILSKTLKHLPFKESEYQVFSVNYYHIENPFSLHCDNLGDGLGFYQLIIPLRVAPEIDTFTIVYDQTSEDHTEWISPAFNKPEDYKPFYNKPIYDPTYYGNWSEGDHISDDDGIKYWGDNWQKTFKEAYHGFSIKSAYKWRVGDIFCFKSHFVHSATDFRYKGIEFKEGILICLQKTN